MATCLPFSRCAATLLLALLTGSYYASYAQLAPASVVPQVRVQLASELHPPSRLPLAGYAAQLAAMPVRVQGPQDDTARWVTIPAVQLALPSPPRAGYGARQLLWELRRQAASTSGVTRSSLLRAGQRYQAQLLFPHGQLSPGQWRWRKYQRPGNAAELAVAADVRQHLREVLKGQLEALQAATPLTRMATPAAGATLPSLPLRLGIYTVRLVLEELGTGSYRLRLQETNCPAAAAALPSQVVNVVSQPWYLTHDRPSARDLAEQLVSTLDSNSLGQFLPSELARQLAKLPIEQERVVRTVAGQKLLFPTPQAVDDLRRLQSIQADTTAFAAKYGAGNLRQRFSFKYIYRRLASVQQEQMARQSQLEMAARGQTTADLLPATPPATARTMLANELVPAIAQLLLALTPPAAAPAHMATNLLYTSQLLLPTLPTRRIARLYIHDQGAQAAANNQGRYIICLFYSATDASFNELTALATGSGAVATVQTAGGCAPQTGFVGVTLALAALERTAFVEGLHDALVQKDSLLVRSALLQRDKTIAGDAQAALITKQRILGSGAATAAASPTFTSSASRVLSPPEQALLESLRDLYDDYLRQKERLTLAPSTGVVLLGQRLHVYESTDAEDNATLPHVFAVDSVMMEVEDGNALGIKAYGQYQDRTMLFETYAPLNLSSDYDLQKSWYSQVLFAQGSLRRTHADYGLNLRLDELLRYYPLLVAHSSDRSPADQVYTFRPQDPLARRVLQKVPTSKILQARIYSDLLGIANDRPNGLLQAEVYKKFILYNNFSKASRKGQFGYLNYVQPSVAVYKIEDNNRRLPLSTFGKDGSGNSINPQARTVRTIDLLRYTNLRIGATLNLLSLKIPGSKSDF